jgi:excinuclease ABC subunit C
MASPNHANLRKRIARASKGPGVYRWLDADGTIIYVGKAKNLQSRLKSYVMENAAKGQGPWKQSMFEQLADFDVTIVNSELEALILETNLIKKLRPKYNVLMKDDKNYVYVKITVQDAYPSVEIVRKLEDPTSSARGGLRRASGAKYFGPYLSPYEVRKTLDMLHGFFGFRACKESISAMNKLAASPTLTLPRRGREQNSLPPSGEGPGMGAQEQSPVSKLRPCLDYQIGQCNGLCAGKLTKDEYRTRINAVIDFFKGNFDPVLKRGKELMMQLASEKKFERASEIRDTLAVIEGMREKQIISDTSGDDVDVVGVAVLSGKAHVEVLQKRMGKLIGEHHLALMGKAESVSDVLEQFLPQYYVDAADIPEAVLVSDDFPGREALQEFLTEERGKKVKVLMPERGNKSHLLDLAEKNAQEKAKQAEASWEAEERNVRGALEELTAGLSLPSVPARIEGYDISHTGGTETVGSMVVFVNGKPKNDQYRSFTIHSMQKGAIDDYRALKEVLARRLRHATGGLKMEEKKFAENGIMVSKAKKDEQKKIEEIVARYPQELSQRDIDYKKFLVARHDGDIIGLVRMRDWGNGIKELSSLWVEESYRGGKLGSFLARSLLRTVKKGKIYVRTLPELEQYYGVLGFRHVLKSPQVFIDRWEQVKKENPETLERLVMMYEVIQHKPDTSLSSLPSLLVIDGGKGQLNAVCDVLKEFQVTIPVIGLAKREEEVFIPGKSDPIIFRQDSPAKFMLMRLRDEAHRFANRGRERRALKHAVESQLDRIPSIGPDSKRELLKAFGSVDNIRRQSDEALKTILNEDQLRAMRQIL